MSACELASPLAPDLRRFGFPVATGFARLGESHGWNRVETEPLGARPLAEALDIALPPYRLRDSYEPRLA